MNSRLVRANLIGTVVFLAALAVGVPFKSDRWAQVLVVVVSLVLFAAGVAMSLWAYARALELSRVRNVGVANLFLLTGETAPKPVKWWMSAALAVQVVWTLALGMLAATVNVFFRDVGQLVNVGLLFWFWLTPIVYPATVLPAWAQGWAWLNPFAVFVHHYQQVFVYARLPAQSAWLALAALAAAGLALLWFGWRVYQQRAPEMADEL